MIAFLDLENVDAAQARPSVPVSRPTSRTSGAITYDQPASFYSQWTDALAAYREEVEELDDNWDDFGSKAPSPELLESASDLMRFLRERGIPAPHDFSVSPQGEITLCWFGSRENYFEIRVPRPYDARWMAVLPGCPARHGKTITYDMTQWLVAVLRQQH
jgi:hypothetical protein